MIPNYSAQEIFTKVVTHLRKQGKQSMNGLSCAYLSPKSEQCAIGCLIPPEDYDPKMESRQVESFFQSDSPFANLFAPIANHVDLLVGLQILHDGEDVCDWENGFSFLAKRFNLCLIPA